MLKKNSLGKILMVVACICTFLFTFTSDVKASDTLDSNTKVKVWVEPICDNTEIYLYDITLGDFERLIYAEIPSKLSQTNNFLIVFEHASHFNEFRSITDRLNSKFKNVMQFQLQYIDVIDPNHLSALKEYGFTEIATVAYLAILPVETPSQT